MRSRFWSRALIIGAALGFMDVIIYFVVLRIWSPFKVANWLMPLIFPQMPGMLVGGFILQPFLHFFRIGIVVQGVISCLLNGMFYAWLFPVIAKFFRAASYYSLPRDMQTGEPVLPPRPFDRVAELLKRNKR